VHSIACPTFAVGRSIAHVMCILDGRHPLTHSPTRDRRHAVSHGWVRLFPQYGRQGKPHDRFVVVQACPSSWAESPSRAQALAATMPTDGAAAAPTPAASDVARGEALKQ